MPMLCVIQGMRIPPPLHCPPAALYSANKTGFRMQLAPFRICRASSPRSAPPRSSCSAQPVAMPGCGVRMVSLVAHAASTTPSTSAVNPYRRLWEVRPGLTALPYQASELRGLLRSEPCWSRSTLNLMFRIGGLWVQEAQAYLESARLHNTGPAVGLVLLGAWAGSGRSCAVLATGSVWVTAAIASCKCCSTAREGGANS